jgi:hypothetical protein
VGRTRGIGWLVTSPGRRLDFPSAAQFCQLLQMASLWSLKKVA